MTSSSLLSVVVLTLGWFVVFIDFVVSFESMNEFVVVCDGVLVVDNDVDESIVFEVELSGNAVVVSSVVDGEVDDDVASVDCFVVTIVATVVLLADVVERFVGAKGVVLSVDGREEDWSSTDVVCGLIAVVDLIVVDDDVVMFVGKVVVFPKVVFCVVVFIAVVTRGDDLAVVDSDVDIGTAIFVVDAPERVVEVVTCGALVDIEFGDDTLVGSWTFVDDVIGSVVVAEIDEVVVFAVDGVTVTE